jgi:hypothetical protein
MSMGRIRLFLHPLAGLFHIREPEASVCCRLTVPARPGPAACRRSGLSTLRAAYALLGLALAVLLPACGAAPTSTAADAPAAPPELLQTNYLYEVVRYLYRWHLDESEVERIVVQKQFVFWVRRLEPKLDPGDHSRLGEILLPQLNLSVKVKKADYAIEELGVVVKSPNFRITRILRGQVPARKPRDCAVVEMDMKEMRDYLFGTRFQHDYPDAELVERLRQAVRQEAAKEGILATNNPTGDQVVHLAPLSPVANDIWVFWEAGRKLFYFASDIDLANPAVWKHETLVARIFDLDHQVVVSHEEAPGSNRFLTRYQVSRALFNCILLGQRVTVPAYVPPSGTLKPPARR